MRFKTDPKEEHYIDPYENLALAIIKMACQDYLLALYNKKRGNLFVWDDKGHHRMTIKVDDLIEDCESFFKSKWYSLLCSIPGEDLIQKLKEKEGYDD